MFSSNQTGLIKATIYSGGSPSSLLDIQARINPGELDLVTKPAPASQLISLTLELMAKTALEMWPQWYRVWAPGQEIFISDIFEAGQSADKSVELIWLKQALAEVLSDRPPILPHLSSEIQARQLALAIGHRINGLRFILPPDIASSAYKLALAKSVEWLNQETGLSINVILPSSVVDDDDLASLMYNAEKYTGQQPELSGIVKNLPDTDQYDTISNTPSFIGRPNPQSPGELELADYLRKDQRLSDLFSFNIQLDMEGGQHYIVDLLWASGRLVVEIDGYQYHSNKISFRDDRQRDYVLLINGYLVLRLTHDEVMSDTQLAVEKINDVVNYIRQKRV